MIDLVDRNAAIDEAYKVIIDGDVFEVVQVETLEGLPSIDAVEIVRCKDCIFGHLYINVQNGVTDSWVECRNPDGLNRDVSIDGYCSASIRRNDR